MIRVCFVCLGNICRSPTAAGIFAHLVSEAGLDHAVAVDSAGTAAYHVGERPDARAQATARSRGITLPGCGEHFTAPDLDRFDYVVAMDRSNRTDLLRLARSDEQRTRIHLLRTFDPAAPPEAEVPDPYYGGAAGFDAVFNICTAACRGLLQHIRVEHGV